MAQDLWRLMRLRGHNSRLSILYSMTIGDALARTDTTFAQMWRHWFFLGQTAQPAERVINADPQAWYRPDEQLMETMQVGRPASKLAAHC